MKILLIAILILFSIATLKASDTISFNHSFISYSGRIEMQPDVARFYWPGSSAKMYFKGSSVGITLKDETGANYYNIIIDENVIHRIKPTQDKKTYTFNLKDSIHSIEVFKRTEYTNGFTNFYGFVLPEKAKALHSSAPERRIVFYGNSISAGYAVEDYVGKDRPDSIYTNHYLAYPAITARNLDARETCICRSGIGISVSWYPLTMPELYHRLNPFSDSSKWNFNKEYADVVVVNLLQNDSWIIKKRKHPAYQQKFGNRKVKQQEIIAMYIKFIEKLKGIYPESHIVCMLGNMDITKKKKWSKTLQKELDNLDNESISLLVVPYKKSPGHPTVEEQQKLAEALTQHIKKVKNW